MSAFHFNYMNTARSVFMAEFLSAEFTSKDCSSSL